MVFICGIMTAFVESMAGMAVAERRAKMIGDKDRKDDEPSDLHWWGGALSGGATVPYSWMFGGRAAAMKGMKGAVIGGLLGLNSIFDDDKSPDEDADRWKD